MALFKVLLKGENLFMKSKGSVKRFGFYATRVVVALDTDEAERHAIKSVQRDERFRGNVLNDDSNPPSVSAEEIEELSSSEGAEKQSTGIAFFLDELKPQ